MRSDPLCLSVFLTVALKLLDMKLPDNGQCWDDSERQMHIHRTPLDLNISNLFNAEAARKAAEAKKAAEVRRKLLRASASIGDETQSFENLAVSQREGESSGQDSDAGSQGHYAFDAAQSRTPRKTVDEQPEKPLSIWA